LATAGHKDPGALKTIGELSQELGVAQHILRYWETKFSQLRPMQRAGNRRYYRAGDVDLARRINRWLNHEGYTVRGVQKLLRERGDPMVQGIEEMPAPLPPAERGALGSEGPSGVDVFRLIQLRNRLVEALED
jgi:DNA-binding transcriptional MerR regulator